MTLFVWLDDVGDPVQLIDLGFMAVELLPEPFDLEDAVGWSTADICLN